MCFEDVRVGDETHLEVRDGDVRGVFSAHRVSAGDFGGQLRVSCSERFLSCQLVGDCGFWEVARGGFFGVQRDASVELLEGVVSRPGRALDGEVEDLLVEVVGGAAGIGGQLLFLLLEVGEVCGVFFGVHSALVSDPHVLFECVADVDLCGQGSESFVVFALRKLSDQLVLDRAEVFVLVEDFLARSDLEAVSALFGKVEVWMRCSVPRSFLSLVL